MRRVLRLSLAQMLLLVALIALVTSIVVVFQSRFGVAYNDPSLAVSPDGKTLASAHSVRPLFRRKHPVVVKNLAELDSAATAYEAHRWLVRGVAFSPAGESLYSVGDRSIRQWDRAGVERSRIDTGTHAADCLAISPDGRLAATGGQSEVKVWDLESRHEIATLAGQKHVWDVAFSPDGRYLVSGALDGTLRVWDTQGWQLASAVPADGPSNIAFTPDGKLVSRGYEPAAGEKSWSVNATLYEIPSGKVLEVFPVKKSWAAVSSVAVSRNGKLLAAAHGGDRNIPQPAVTIWDLESKEELATLNVGQHGDNWIDEMEFSANGETLFCASHNNVVTAQQWRTGKSTVLFADGRVFPWGLAVGGGLSLIVAWYAAGQQKKSGRKAAVDDS